MTIFVWPGNIIRAFFLALKPKNLFYEEYY